MFEITAEDIAALSDETLRTLIGRLCEAEVSNHGLSASTVTWGGNQNAADGGLDVRVDLPSDAAITGYVPRSATGFQVKKSDLPPSAIIAEMCPQGSLRPVISDLANKCGAYIIVASGRSTSDTMLKNRREAMGKAIGNSTEESPLLLDFYDPNRIATWVRQHPGLIAWVREAAGRPIVGWRSYDAWAYSPEGVSAEYVLDDHLRVHTGRREEEEKGLSALQGIEQIRTLLQESKRIVRLVGLSGVGKTRLIQALFDERVGERSLDPALAFYTNIGDEPIPSPIVHATSLIQARTRAILIIDNCPSSLHQRLVELCRSVGSKVSLISVEYDIRDDEPEGTDVFELKSSSNDLVVKLIAHRFPEISEIDRETIANCSGGNARLAIVLASSVGRGESISGLTDDELFRRLFVQKHAPDDSLLAVAEACSLFYSFQGDGISTDPEAELPTIGALIGKTASDVYRYVAELRRRDLVQSRNVWRAVLPHAMANRLAATALENIPQSVINEQIIYGGSARLLKSFSRRLGYLHDCPKAIAIVDGWMKPDGLLGSAPNLNELGRAIFENVAPVAPEAALNLLERAILGSEDVKTEFEGHAFVHVLRKIAYDPNLFERSVLLLTLLARREQSDQCSNDNRQIIISFFNLFLSGTHATRDQRLNVVKSLVFSTDPFKRRLGFDCLNALLEARNFSSHYNFEFGIRSRNHGYRPSDKGEIQKWFGSAIDLVVSLASSDKPYRSEVRTILADQFRGLWTCTREHDKVEHACRVLASQYFWREGWLAVRQTLLYNTRELPPDITVRLTELEQHLRPKNLVQTVRAIVLSRGVPDVNVEIFKLYHVNHLLDEYARLEALANALGNDVAINDQAFDELVPELFGFDGSLHWSFGRGLIKGTRDCEALWNQLVSAFGTARPEVRNIQVLRGCLSALKERDQQLTGLLLDAAVRHEILGPYFPVLQTAIAIDSQGVNRLRFSLSLGIAPIHFYENIAYGRISETIAGEELSELVLNIASKTGGFPVATAIIHMRLESDKALNRCYTPAVVETGMKLLRVVTFDQDGRQENYHLAMMAQICLSENEGVETATNLSRKLHASKGRNFSLSRDHPLLLKALFTVQPYATLDRLFHCEDPAQELRLNYRHELEWNRGNAIDQVPEEVLLKWCDQEPDIRYPIIASVINHYEAASQIATSRWKPIALRLLEKAPDRIRVLEEYIRNFKPLQWSGSRAAIMESNARLLDDLSDYPDKSVAAYVLEAKLQFERDLRQEKEWEATRDKNSYERFE